MDLGLWILRITSIFRQGPSRRLLHAIIGVSVVASICVFVESMGWWPEWLAVERGPRIPLMR